ncbi:uncharacterized protein DUF4136 [Algoriphagus boseongensis]|uniref:Uncharacterized protein DUF4136 n=1 Tax=Algoriphagus boseongensis TaxID=1442587 RepID=A0A4R6TB33_9BACT|nr:DUF4136 domain-containing protein [Algoriphagus boseongensis]TDQ18865.1 uncharacterized protein DUF4136 [Algoriphagus boseongensis]
MKRIFILMGVAALMFSCKVSDTITIDSLSDKENIKGYQTFKMVETPFKEKRNNELTKVFQDRLLEYGFEQSDENPDFLIQSVLVTREFIQELGQTYASPGPFIYSPNGISGSSGGRSKFVINKGMIGKVIFLIQDANNLEIAWMGVGTGVLTTGNRFDEEKLSIALDHLLASID